MVFDGFSSTSYNWLLTTLPLYGRKSSEKPKFQTSFTNVLNIIKRVIYFVKEVYLFYLRKWLRYVLPPSGKGIDFSLKHGDLTLARSLRAEDQCETVEEVTSGNHLTRMEHSHWRKHLKEQSYNLSFDHSIVM